MTTTATALSEKKATVGGGILRRSTSTSSSTAVGAAVTGVEGGSALRSYARVPPSRSGSAAAAAALTYKREVAQRRVKQSGGGVSGSGGIGGKVSLSKFFSLPWKSGGGGGNGGVGGGGGGGGGWADEHNDGAYRIPFLHESSSQPPARQQYNDYHDDDDESSQSSYRSRRSRGSSAECSSAADSRGDDPSVLFPSTESVLTSPSVVDYASSSPSHFKRHSGSSSRRHKASSSLGGSSRRWRLNASVCSSDLGSIDSVSEDSSTTGRASELKYEPLLPPSEFDQDSDFENISVSSVGTDRTGAGGALPPLNVGREMAHVPPPPNYPPPSPRCFPPPPPPPAAASHEQFALSSPLPPSLSSSATGALSSPFLLSSASSASSSCCSVLAASPLLPASSPSSCSVGSSSAESGTGVAPLLLPPERGTGDDGASYSNVGDDDDDDSSSRSSFFGFGGGSSGLAADGRDVDDNEEAPFQPPAWGPRVDDTPFDDDGDVDDTFGRCSWSGDVTEVSHSSDHLLPPFPSPTNALISKPLSGQVTSGQLMLPTRPALVSYDEDECSDGDGDCSESGHLVFESEASGDDDDDNERSFLRSDDDDDDERAQDAEVERFLQAEIDRFLLHGDASRHHEADADALNDAPAEAAPTPPLSVSPSGGRKNADDGEAAREKGRRIARSMLAKTRTRTGEVEAKAEAAVAARVVLPPPPRIISPYAMASGRTRLSRKGAGRRGEGRDSPIESIAQSSSVSAFSSRRQCPSPKPQDVDTSDSNEKGGREELLVGDSSSSPSSLDYDTDEWFLAAEEGDDGAVVSSEEDGDRNVDDDMMSLGTSFHSTYSFDRLGGGFSVSGALALASLTSAAQLGLRKNGLDAAHARASGSFDYYDDALSRAARPPQLPSDRGAALITLRRHPPPRTPSGERSRIRTRTPDALRGRHRTEDLLSQLGLGGPGAALSVAAARDALETMRDDLDRAEVMTERESVAGDGDGGGDEGSASDYDLDRHDLKTLEAQQQRAPREETLLGAQQVLMTTAESGVNNNYCRSGIGGAGAIEGTKKPGKSGSGGRGKRHFAYAGGTITIPNYSRYVRRAVAAFERKVLSAATSSSK